MVLATAFVFLKVATMRKSHSFAFTLFLLIIVMISCQSVTEKPTPTADAQAADMPQNPIATNRQVLSTPENEITKQTSLAHGIEDFAPQGWFVLAKAEGDLNSDGRVDAVAIFSKSNPKLSKTDKRQTDEALEAPRVLVIALRDRNNQLELAATNERIVLSRRLGGMNDDPFISLAITNQSIKIEQWILGTDGYEYTHTIRHQHNQWLIDGELNFRDRRKGTTKVIRQKQMSLSEFDINDAFPMK